MFEWEEGAFMGVKSLYERMVTRPRERRASAVRVFLAPNRQRLFLLAHLMAERSISVFETEENALCDDERVFLPPQVSFGPSVDANREFLDLKAMIGGVAIRKGWKPGPLPSDWRSQVPELACRLDDVQNVFGECSLLLKLGNIRPRSGTSDDARADGSDQEAAEPFEENEDAPVTEIEGKGQLDVEVELDTGDDGPGGDMPIHTFEKTETLEEHTGLSRKSDDEDELEEHEEALKEVAMNRVFRSRDRPRSIYRADALFQVGFFESNDVEAKGIPYPEWDYRKKDYRPDWCRVRESNVVESDCEWASQAERKYRALIRELKKKVACLATVSLRAKRQTVGSEFDVDALVDWEIDLRTGKVPDDRLYIDRRKRLHDVAALVLVDRSFSTDGYLDGRRILDIIRDTLLCVGEAIDDFVDTFAVAAFSSNTRQQCAFDWVKRFDEDWSSSRGRLGSIHANGYTRIGPALRHAQESLVDRPEERKVVALITDGRPCDYDRYEGEYGVRDVKKAIDTGKRNGIATHAFAVEDRAKEYFPAMFARDCFSIVPRPRALTESLTDLFLKIRAND